MTTAFPTVSTSPQSLDPGDISARLAGIHARIEAAAKRAGRSPTDVLLVAVSKGVETGRVGAALLAGQLDFGESRAQELTRKVARCGPAARWHFVGRLQRNKVADVVGVAQLIHSVDRLELAEALAARARAIGVTQRVLVQVNVGDDPAKAGVEPAAAPELVTRVQALEGLSCAGLMTVPPLAGDPRPCFAALAGLRDALQARFEQVRHVSMGMSRDFEVAVEEGATIVRVGEAVFGARAR
jgi:pyridoxal phosphate enzyme (YggS family)